MPEVVYLGGVINYRGDLSSELQQRHSSARKAGAYSGKFWSKKLVSRTFWIAVSRPVVRSTLLSGLEAIPHTRLQYAEM